MLHSIKYLENEFFKNFSYGNIKKHNIPRKKFYKDIMISTIKNIHIAEIKQNIK